jgi:DNA-directed RNA polymerase subunit M/transcription elongation factor TFIIS
MAPKEDPNSHRLLLECRMCHYIQRDDVDALVSKVELKKQVASNLEFSPDSIYDPALVKTNQVLCPQCSTRTCFVQRSQEQMELVYICCNPACKFIILNAPNK